MANVRKSIAKTSKTLTATKAQADTLAEKQKDEAQKIVKPKKVSKPSSAKKSLEKTESKPVTKKTVTKKISVKGKTTAKIKEDMRDKSTLYPLGGMLGEELIHHHQKRVEFLRKHPEDNKSIHPSESWKNSRKRRGLSVPQRKFA